MIRQHHIDWLNKAKMVQLPSGRRAVFDQHGCYTSAPWVSMSVYENQGGNWRMVDHRCRFVAQETT